MAPCCARALQLRTLKIRLRTRSPGLVCDANRNIFSTFLPSGLRVSTAVWLLTHTSRGTSAPEGTTLTPCRHKPMLFQCAIIRFNHQIERASFPDRDTCSGLGLTAATTPTRNSTPSPSAEAGLLGCCAVGSLLLERLLCACRAGVSNGIRLHGQIYTSYS